MTFRRPAEEVAYQRQVRDSRVDDPVPPVPHLDLSRAIVRPVSRRVAESVILRYEWLGTMSNTSAHFGIFFGPFVAGATCIGTNCSAGVYVHQQYGIGRAELLVLARGACVHWAPPGTNSKLISWTVRILRKERAGKLLLAYADTDAGEIGTVYQASNWTYIGRGAILDDWISPEGEASQVYNQQLPFNIAKSHGGTSRRWTKALLRAGWTRQKSNPKHRYVVVVDRADRDLVRRVEAMALPYPKRARVV